MRLAGMDLRIIIAIIVIPIVVVNVAFLANQNGVAPVANYHVIIDRSAASDQVADAFYSQFVQTVRASNARINAQTRKEPITMAEAQTYDAVIQIAGADAGVQGQLSFFINGKISSQMIQPPAMMQDGQINWLADAISYQVIYHYSLQTNRISAAESRQIDQWLESNLDMVQ